MGLFNGFRRAKSVTAVDSPVSQQRQQQLERQQQRQQQAEQQQQQQQQQEALQQRQSTISQQRHANYPDLSPESDQEEDAASEEPVREYPQAAPEPYAPPQPFSAAEPFQEQGSMTPPRVRRHSNPLLASNNSSLYSRPNGAHPSALVSGASTTKADARQSEQSPYDVPYGHTRVFVAASYDQVLDRTVACLEHQGFHVLASIDLQHSLRAAKVQCGDFRRYTILTACYPKLLFKGIFEEPSLGLLPPSQVVVMEGDFNKLDIVVQVTKPSTIYRALHNQSPKLRGILSETDGRLKMALDGIASINEDSYG